MKYEAVIGLEVHAELSTKSKIYCSCSTGFGAPINTHTCPVCTGMPGALPVLNKQVVHYAAKMGKATGCTINQLCKADRKNYFYPDLPKAYQISQFDVPICENGEVFFYVDGVKHSCRLERIHFEEDAGKLLHDEIDGTIVDFNRCGVPLIEMVTRPDLHSSAEAKEFLEMIKTTLSYLDICDCKMEEGSIRCDVNVSIRPEGSTELGTRVEMKNINTFSGAVRAIDYEIARQIEVVENGGEIQQETRRWDDVKLKNTVMRTKEDAQDYRYFPDPDLIAVEISDEWLHQIESEVPELPITRYERYLNEYGMTAMEARLLSDSFEKAELLDALQKDFAGYDRLLTKLRYHSPKMGHDDDLNDRIAGELLERQDVKAAYMPQNYEERLDDRLTPVEFLAPEGDKGMVTKARTFLGSVKYTPEEMAHPIAALSGGQKAKLLFIKMILDGCNVLVLDEPTRNFSPLSNPVIRRVLRCYGGAIISISHDRKYIGEVCDQVLRLTPEGILPVEWEK